MGKAIEVPMALGLVKRSYGIEEAMDSWDSVVFFP
jgi:hypothetical protein